MAAFAKAGGKLDVANAGSNSAYGTVATTHAGFAAADKTALDAAKAACDTAKVTCEPPSSGSNVWVWVLVVLAIVLAGMGVYWWRNRENK